jgi:hypothetical protein
LEAWCDPDTPYGQQPYVWVWDKDGSARKRKAPQNIFTASDLYTLKAPNGARDLRLELGLSSLESDFSAVRREKLAVGKVINVTERLTVIAFVAAMHSRSRPYLVHWAAQLNRILTLGQEMQKAYQNATPEKRKAIQRMSIPSSTKGTSLEEIRQVVEQPQKLLYQSIKTELNIMWHMSVALMEAPGGYSFITSDAPVVWTDPTAHMRAPGLRSFGLGFKTIEVTMPISPQLLLHLSWYSELDCRRYTLPPEAIGEANRGTRFHCKDHFVTNSDRKDDLWFVEIDAPEFP